MQEDDAEPILFGYPPGFARTFGRHPAHFPFSSSGRGPSVDEVGALSMERPGVEDTALLRELLEPFGIADIMGFAAMRTGGRVVSMHVSRRCGAAQYSLQDIRVLQLLAPHVSRALAISDVLAQRARHAEVLEITLDALSTGVFLTARDGRVHHLNEAAKRQVRTGAAIGLVNGHLSPTHAGARAALLSAMAAMTEEAAHDPSSATAAAVPAHARHEHDVAMPDGDGRGCVAAVLALRATRRRDVLAPPAAAVAVFTQDPAHAPPLPARAFATLHKLTDAEVRVLLAIAQGLNGMEAAGALGISEATVRTHLRRLYSKTGTLRQGDLVRLLHDSAPPVGGAGKLPGHFVRGPQGTVLA